MAICLECGCIFPSGQKHKCKPENIPAANTEKKPLCSEILDIKESV